MPNPALPTAAYIPALDGLRAFAVGAVLLTHGSGVIRGGNLGVDVFFVLSGYLITTLLIAEREKTGHISLGRFFARRGLRLMPALLAMVICCAIFAMTTKGFDNFDLSPVFFMSSLVVLLYLSDFVLGWGSGHLSGPYFHTWSLAVEEHFYLLWPPLVAVLSKKRVGGPIALWLALAVAGAAAIWTAVLWMSGAPFSRVAFSFDTRGLIGLSIGCALGTALRTPAVSDLARRFSFWAVLAFGALASLIMLGPSDSTLALGGFLIIDVLAAILVAGCIQGASLVSRFFSLRPLQVIGKRAYGIYLWHLPAFVVVETWALATPLSVGLKVLLAAVLVEVSWRFVEQPALRLRHRFAPSSRRARR